MFGCGLPVCAVSFSWYTFIQNLPPPALMTFTSKFLISLPDIIMILSLLVYGSIEELVKVDENGLLFSSSSELADELLVCLDGKAMYPNYNHTNVWKIGWFCFGFSIGLLLGINMSLQWFVIFPLLNHTFVLANFV